MADILVVGHFNADLVVRAPRFPAPGDKARYRSWSRLDN